MVKKTIQRHEGRGKTYRGRVTKKGGKRTYPFLAKNNGFGQESKQVRKEMGLKGNLKKRGEVEGKREKDSLERRKATYKRGLYLRKSITSMEGAQRRQTKHRIVGGGIKKPEKWR